MGSGHAPNVTLIPARKRSFVDGRSAARWGCATYPDFSLRLRSGRDPRSAGARLNAAWPCTPPPHGWSRMLGICRALRTMSDMAVGVVVLNGGSSAGKTSIGRCLQNVLPRPWLLLGVDDLINAAPSSLISYGPHGEVVFSDQWRALETAWSRGVASMARAGAGVILDDVFLDGAVSQQRTSEYLKGLEVLWVGVQCAPEVAAARERVRGDRPTGMAAAQAEAVHRGVTYDLIVDSSTSSPEECARRITTHLT